MTYTISQVEELTGLKPHILRYWEEVIPGFSPKKELSGRRIYSQRDLELIFRLKYLITKRKFSAQRAGQQVLHEAQFVSENADIIQQIYECREELVNVLLELRAKHVEL
ncbi:MAG: MerR family transcriptional regulator [Treponema sp.]|jgi:DNA-binding transcriptional MerR regulator|nr:MerR family transcriptional regulator [Treponema sp.]